jgi:hypothetical protein
MRARCHWCKTVMDPHITGYAHSNRVVPHKVRGLRSGKITKSKFSPICLTCLLKQRTDQSL